MEARFGEDFSNVRVHTNLESAESATAANALAYAIGSDIVFAPGFYDPETTAGKQLLAHELTHVVQQGRGEGISAGLVHEHEAEDVSRRLWSSPKVFVRTRSQRGIPQYAHDPNRSTTLTDDNLLQMLNRFPKGEDITLYHVDREGGFSQSARRSGRNFKLRAGELWLTTNVEARTGFGGGAGLENVIAFKVDRRFVTLAAELAQRQSSAGKAERGLGFILGVKLAVPRVNFEGGGQGRKLPEGDVNIAIRISKSTPEFGRLFRLSTRRIEHLRYDNTKPPGQKLVRIDQSYPLLTGRGPVSNAPAAPVNRPQETTQTTASADKPEAAKASTGTMAKKIPASGAPEADPSATTEVAPPSTPSVVSPKPATPGNVDPESNVQACRVTPPSDPSATTKVTSPPPQPTGGPKTETAEGVDPESTAPAARRVPPTPSTDTSRAESQLSPTATVSKVAEPAAGLPARRTQAVPPPDSVPSAEGSVPAKPSAVRARSSVPTAFRANLKSFAGDAALAGLNMLAGYLAAKAQEHFDQLRWESDMQRIQAEIQISVDKSATTILEAKSNFPGAKIFANVTLRSTTVRTVQSYAMGTEEETVDQTAYYGTDLVDVKVSPCETNSQSESVKREAPLLGFGGTQETYTTTTIYSFELPPDLWPTSQGAAGPQPGTGAYAASIRMPLQEVDRQTHWTSGQRRQEFINEYIEFAKTKPELRDLYKQGLEVLKKPYRERGTKSPDSRVEAMQELARQSLGGTEPVPGTGAYAALQQESLVEVDKRTHWRSEKERQEFIKSYIRFAREKPELQNLYKQAIADYPLENWLLQR